MILTGSSMHPVCELHRFRLERAWTITQTGLVIDLLPLWAVGGEYHGGKNAARQFGDIKTTSSLRPLLFRHGSPYCPDPTHEKAHEPLGRIEPVHDDSDDIIALVLVFELLRERVRVLDVKPDIAPIGMDNEVHTGHICLRPLLRPFPAENPRRQPPNISMRSQDIVEVPFGCVALLKFDPTEYLFQSPVHAASRFFGFGRLWNTTQQLSLLQ